MRYLLASPAVGFEHLRERGVGVKVMIFKDAAAGRDDLVESQPAGQEGGHGGLVGAVEGRPGGAAAGRCFQAELQGAEALEVGRLETQVLARLQSSFAATPASRSGQLNAYWIGSFMSGGLNWAITEPSLNSTIECTID